MPRRPAPAKLPTYCLHKPSGRAVVTLTDRTTKRRRAVYLGAYGTPESRAEFERVIADWLAGGKIVARGHGEPPAGDRIAGRVSQNGRVDARRAAHPEPLRRPTINGGFEVGIAPPVGHGEPAGAGGLEGEFIDAARRPARFVVQQLERRRLGRR